MKYFCQAILEFHATSANSIIFQIPTIDISEVFFFDTHYEKKFSHGGIQQRIRK